MGYTLFYSIQQVLGVLLLARLIAYQYPRQPLPSSLDVLDTRKARRQSSWNAMWHAHTHHLDDVIVDKGQQTVVDFVSSSSRLRRLFQGVQGPESVHVLENGTMVALDKYGHVYVNQGEKGYSLFAYVGPGRPLGIHAMYSEEDGEDVLVICNSLTGVLSLGLVTKRVLRSSYYYNDDDGGVVPIMYANDVDIDMERRIVYFTDSTVIPPALNRASFYDTMLSYLLSAASGAATGKLLSYDVNSGRTRLLVDGIFFANGVAVDRKGEYVLVAETSSLRILKYHVSNGTTEVLVDGLPGFPDGISRCHGSSLYNTDNNNDKDEDFFWVAIIIPCDSGRIGGCLGLHMMRAPAMVRWVLSYVFRYIGSPPVGKIGLVLKVSGVTGDIVQVLVDRHGDHVAGVSGVYQHGSTLFMGHLSHDYITAFNLSSIH